MNFKRIEVFGFKSFADKLVIQFEPGITAIVGPNGCGKSNVADSIRWVLGEQSAKLLRGSNMQDVIFNGTQNRKSLSYCEVSLYFDNTSRIFDVDYNEVSITRKLYRSGESEYAINKKVCRLKDITDLLRQTGMGRDGYSIIGQGKIDEILSSKPGDRRAIFEEATGISKFKAKKVETERKLTRTRENLTRINDILGELERQIEPLRKQSEDAKKYLELKESLKYHEINNYIYQYDSAATVKQEFDVKLAGILEELQLRESEHSRLNEEYDTCLQNIANADKDIENLRDEQLELTVSLEKQTGEANVNRERVKFMQEQNQRLEEEIHALTGQYQTLTSQMEEKTASRESCQAEFARLTEESAKLQETFLELVGRISQGEDENQTQQQEMIDAINQMSEIKANLSGWQAEKAALDENFQNNGNRLTALFEEIEGGKMQLAEIESRIEKLEAEKRAAEEHALSCRTRLNQTQTRLKDAHRKVAELKNLLSSLETKEKLMTSMRNSMDGYQYSVKRLMQNAETNGELKRRIEGVVARLMTVPEQFETAVEIALGAATQNIVTATREDAKYLITYLKQNKFGRATFLPIDGVKPRSLDGGEMSVLRTPGCYGVASDLISYDKKYAGIYRSLLGKTIIVDNLDTAIAISKMRDLTFKIVTLEGDVMAPGGAMTGGSRKSDAATSTIGYDRELKATKEELERTGARLAEAKAVRGAEEAAELRAQEDLQEAERRTHRAEIALVTAGEGESKLQAKRSELSDSVDKLEAENRGIEERRRFLTEALKQADEIGATLKEQNSTTDAELRKKYEQFAELKAQRDAMSERLTAIKVKLAEHSTFLAANAEEIKRLAGSISATDESIRKATSGIATNNEIIEACKAAIEHALSQVTDNEKINDIRYKLKNLDVFKFDLNAKLAEVDRKRQEVSAEIQRVSDSKLKVEFNLEKVDTDIAAMQDRIWEEYKCTYESALQYKDEGYDMAGSTREINRLKRQIQNLGFVNVNAIEQYQQVGERYEDMNTQRNDLVKAEEDLVKIITDLTGEMVERFNDGFQKINENFVVIFKELFGGGNANLVLEPAESGNPLEDGIEIVAEPPGKKLQSISLLSGGERALTAIAILFAILRLRPMPFCVLDEIEAALDDANADRFARYLHKFSRQTQFIVITHRKPTMELADALYGVTMEEKGVSKMVSVKLSDVVANLTSTA